MATKGHYLAGVDFPVYALGWTGDHQLAATGGGGAGRTGVKNKITLFNVDAPRQKCDKAAELELAKNEDASSTLAVHPERKELVLGINSNVDNMKAGTNANVRVYSYSENAVQAESTHTTIGASDPEIYQKITKYSKDGSKILVTSSKDQLSVLACPSYAKIVPDLHFDDEEMFDADFSEDGSMFLGASSQRIHIWQTEAATAAMPSSGSSEDEGSQPEPFQVIQSPVLSKSLKCSFRAARFGRSSTASRLFTIVNATPHAVSGGGRRGKGGNRGIERKAFITTWDTTTWELLKTRTVSKKPVTSFDVSPDGRMLALGGADLSISIFDAETVRPLLSILAAHDFPSTCLRFSPTSSLLASGSADNTLRIISADAALHPQRHQGLQLALITMLVLLIAVLIQLYAGDKVLEVARRHLHV